MTEHTESFGLVEKEALSESEKSVLLSPDQRMENVNLEEKGREGTVIYFLLLIFICCAKNTSRPVD